MSDGAPETFFVQSGSHGLSRLVVAGELDVLTCGRLRARFDVVLASAAKTIDLDLTAVSFMDSSGVHLLMYMRQRADRRLRVIPSAAVTRVVHVAATAARQRLAHAA